jgi:hypothetical protein
MAAIARAALLTVCLSLHLGAEARNLALYAGPANGLSPLAIRSTQNELQRLLAPAGIDMVWKNLETRKPGEQFDQVVVMSFTGSCSDPGVVSPPRTPLETAVSLADSSVSEGRILPFIRVDCGYLAQMLAPALRSLDAKERDAAFGQALGRVVAHEIYHIIGETTGHQARGVAKASFSVRDLTADDFEFDTLSLAQMRPTTTASATDSDEFAER